MTTKQIAPTTKPTEIDALDVDIRVPLHDRPVTLQELTIPEIERAAERYDIEPWSLLLAMFSLNAVYGATPAKVFEQ